jgi:hypothetical protein
VAAYRPSTSRVVWAELRPSVTPTGPDFAAILKAEVSRLAS